jgi:hypothetical protein
VEAGTPDLLWLYKSQRKAWKRGGKPEEKPREQGTRNQRRKQGGLDRKPGGKPEENQPKNREKKQRKQSINPEKIHREGEKGRGESQISPAIVLVPAIKKERH